MTTVGYGGRLLAAGLALTVAVPTAASSMTFAQFFQTDSNSLLAYTANGGGQGGTLSTVVWNGTNYVNGAATVDFRYQVPVDLSIRTVDALFSFNATASGAITTVGGISFQALTNGTISFTLPSPASVGSAPHTNLLTMSFTDAVLVGQTGSQTLSIMGATPETGVNYSSDFLNFGQGLSRDFSFSLSSATPALQVNGGGQSFRSFRANATGTFAQDPLPGVPEPETWLMMIVGFGAVGLTVRQRRGTGVRVVAA